MRKTSFGHTEFSAVAKIVVMPIVVKDIVVWLFPAAINYVFEVEDIKC